MSSATVSTTTNNNNSINSNFSNNNNNNNKFISNKNSSSNSPVPNHNPTQRKQMSSLLGSPPSTPSPPSIINDDNNLQTDKKKLTSTSSNNRKNRSSSNNSSNNNIIQTPKANSCNKKIKENFTTILEVPEENDDDKKKNDAQQTSKLSSKQPSQNPKTTSKLDFKLINHRLKDLGFEQWIVKRILSLMTSYYVEQQDLLQEQTLDKLRKLYHEQTLLEFLDYYLDNENNNLCESRITTTNDNNNAQSMNNEDASSKINSQPYNKLVFLINKWENQFSVTISADNIAGFINQNGFMNNHHQQQQHFNQTTNRIVNFMTPNSVPHRPGPNMAKLCEMLEHNDYILELSNGQRKYCKSAPVQGSMQTEYSTQNNTEIFVGKIPKDLFEDELVPLFENIGPIYNLRLMMDPLTGLSRGYAFITYFNAEHARTAVEEFDNYELPNYGIQLKVKMSIPNVRLFIGNISKEMSKEDIRHEFQKHTPGLVDVIVYHLPHDRKRNRGFCFLEYESHKHASQAKRKLCLHRMKIWDSEIWVDWAEPLEQPNDEIMSKVKVLYVRNLALEMTDHYIKELFQKFGTIERVKKIKDYAFVHFEDRNCALEAMKQMNGQMIMPGGLELEISLAKPPTDKKRREEILRNREKRLMNMMHTRLSPMFDNNNSTAVVCSNNPATVQTIAFVPPATTTLASCIDPTIIAGTAGAVTPILMNSGATTSDISANHQHHLASTTMPTNFFLGYSSHHHHHSYHHHHHPIYQLPSRSPVARVTLACHNEQPPANSHISSSSLPSHHHSIINGQTVKSDSFRMSESDYSMTGFEMNDYSTMIKPSNDQSDLFYNNQNYCLFENCVWYRPNPIEISSSVPSTQQILSPQPTTSNHQLFAIIPAISVDHYNKMNDNIQQNINQKISSNDHQSDNTQSNSNIGNDNSSSKANQTETPLKGKT